MIFFGLPLVRDGGINKRQNSWYAPEPSPQLRMR